MCVHLRVFEIVTNRMSNYLLLPMRYSIIIARQF